MPKYIVVNQPFKQFYSDTDDEPASPVMGVDPTDLNNVAYTVYNKPFSLFQYLGGCCFIWPSTIPYQPDMVVDCYAENNTTGITANSFSKQMMIPLYYNSTTKVKTTMGMPDMLKLGAGQIEVSGSVTDTVNDIVYVMRSFFFTIQMP